MVLVHGSGPQDADETIGPNKPFADLAYGLASQNVAVLRYVKRTKQYGADSKSDAPFTVKDEVTDDAIAAVALLSKMPEINKKQIYVLGPQPGRHAGASHRRRRSAGGRHHHPGGQRRGRWKSRGRPGEVHRQFDRRRKRRRTRSRSRKPRPSLRRSKARR